jgi:hypothetical protein
VEILKYAAFAICIILVLGLFIPEKIRMLLLQQVELLFLQASLERVEM